jgi:SPP1 gp7 family putative phage head morphogenesis protein
VSDVIDGLNGRKMELLTDDLKRRERLVKEWRALEAALEGRIAQLIAQAEGRVMTAKEIIELSRYQQLARDARAELNKFSEVATGLIDQGVDEAGTVGIEMAQQAMIAQGVSIVPNRLPVEMVSTLVGNLANGTPIYDHLSSQVVLNGMMGQAVNMMVQGLAMGINPTKIARNMQNSMIGGLNQALVVARTEPMRAMRQMQVEQYRQSGIVEGYYRLATRDTRTCIGCLMDDGAFYPVGVDMPEHPQGRCAMVPKVVGYDAPTWQKGSEWFLTLSDEQQKSSLGAERFRRWKSGMIELSDMVSTKDNGVWGKSVGPKPLNN